MPVDESPDGLPESMPSSGFGQTEFPITNDQLEQKEPTPGTTGQESPQLEPEARSDFEPPAPETSQLDPVQIEADLKPLTLEESMTVLALAESEQTVECPVTDAADDEVTVSPLAQFETESYAAVSGEITEPPTDSASDEESVLVVDDTTLETLQRELEVLLQITHLGQMQIDCIRQTAGPGCALLSRKALLALERMSDRFTLFSSIYDNAVIKRFKRTKSGKVLARRYTRKASADKMDKSASTDENDTADWREADLAQQSEGGNNEVIVAPPTRSFGADRVASGKSKNGGRPKSKYKSGKPKNGKPKAALQQSTAESLPAVIARVTAANPRAKVFNVETYDNNPGYQDFQQRLGGVFELSAVDEHEVRLLYHLLSGIRVERLNQFGLRHEVPPGTVTKTLVHLEAKHIQTAAQLILLTSDELGQPVKIGYARTSQCGPVVLSFLSHWLLSLGATFAGETYEQAAARVKQDQKLWKKKKGEKKKKEVAEDEPSVSQSENNGDDELSASDSEIQGEEVLSASQSEKHGEGELSENYVADVPSEDQGDDQGDDQQS
jgi:hypothetical protein